MREDMDKVLVERPRLGLRISKMKGHRRDWRKDPEQAVKRVSVRRGRQTKHFNEHLGPLRRFLQRCVGRPWDKVYSELRARVNPKNAVQLHILQHVDDYVVTRAERRGKDVYDLAGFGPRRPLYRGPRERFYVDPRTGILRLLPDPPRIDVPGAGRLRVDPFDVGAGLIELGIGVFEQVDRSVGPGRVNLCCNAFRQ